MEKQNYNQDDIFAQFEQEAKIIFSKNHNKAFSTELPLFIADFIRDFLSSNHKKIYMVSIGVLVDDIFDICFAKNDHNDRMWNRFATMKGYIGDCCLKSAKSNEAVFVLNGKLSMAKENRLTQKDYFVSDKNLHSFFVAPILVGKNVIGTIQVSFFDEKEEEEVVSIKKSLTICVEKITWILLAEQTKHKATLDAVGAIARTLDIKNEYQANHSKNVSKLALHFLRELVKNHHYIKRLFGGHNNFQGYTALQVRLAALLHDTGKLIMSNESFESIENIHDYCKRQLHAYYTDMVLGYSHATKKISQMAAFHHEKAESPGYPYGIRITDQMVVEQIISLADLIDSMARERPQTNKYSENAKRLEFEEIIDKLLSPKIANRYTKELHSIFVAILMSYKEETKHLGKEIKRLLGISLKSKRSTPRIKTKEKELSLVLNKILKQDSSPITNRWLSALAITIPNNFCLEQKCGIAKDEGSFYMALPKFGTHAGSVKEKQKSKVIEHNYSNNFFNNKTQDNLITVQYKRSSSKSELYYAAFIPHISLAKELSYAICENIFKLDFVNSMSVAFCDSELLYSGDNILRIKQALIESNEQINHRWRLIPASTFY